MIMKKILPNSLFNNLGKVSEENPFHFFGSNPFLGSYIIIGIENLLNSEINILSLEIHWKELPKNLKKYYEAYDKIYSFTNTSHLVEVSVYLNGFCYSLGNYSLFNQDSNGTLLPISQFKLNMKDALSRIQCLQINKDKINSDGFKCGLKMELTRPSVAFGHVEYPTLYTEVVLFNSSLPNDSSKKLSLPNQPFNPVAKKIIMYHD